MRVYEEVCSLETLTPSARLILGFLAFWPKVRESKRLDAPNEKIQWLQYLRESKRLDAPNENVQWLQYLQDGLITQ